MRRTTSVEKGPNVQNGLHDYMAITKTINGVLETRRDWIGFCSEEELKEGGIRYFNAQRVRGFVTSAPADDEGRPDGKWLWEMVIRDTRRALKPLVRKSPRKGKRAFDDTGKGNPELKERFDFDGKGEAEYAFRMKHRAFIYLAHNVIAYAQRLLRSGMSQEMLAELHEAFEAGQRRAAIDKAFLEDAAISRHVSDKTIEEVNDVWKKRDTATDAARLSIFERLQRTTSHKPDDLRPVYKRGAEEVNGLPNDHAAKGRKPGIEIKWQTFRDSVERAQDRKQPKPKA